MASFSHFVSYSSKTKSFGAYESVVPGSVNPIRTAEISHTPDKFVLCDTTLTINAVNRTHNNEYTSSIATYNNQQMTSNRN